MMDTIRLTALIHKGVSRDATAMSAEKVLRMATIVNGKVVYRRGVFSCGIDEKELAERVCDWKNSDYR